jgi:hypothetical protein
MINGKANAKVLPEPVNAMPMRSRPAKLEIDLITSL